MKFNFILIIFTLATTLSLQAQTKWPFDRTKYIDELNKERTLKDAEMKNDDHSPIPDEEKAAFINLHYYKPDVAFRKVAKFERFDQAMHFLMKTTTDRLPEYSLYGAVTFEYKGKSYKLNVYQNIELAKKPGTEKYLFVPFNDATNDIETYGGGRFLDLTETGEETLIIDFNKAYNPYCAYNKKYSCPIPPEANNLKIKINAGEKKWHQ